MEVSQLLLHGRYRVVRVVGRGGMGVVYEAIDERLGVRVALKQTTDADHDFEREARLLARLRHPGLPPVTDYFVDDGGAYLVMHFVDGDDLFALLRARTTPFDVATVLDWADQLLAILDYLHSQRPPVIHRDIKPQNIKRATDGTLMLLDFGIAKGSVDADGDADSVPPTAPSLRAWTPHYAPLEQIEGSGTTPQSDLYSLAVTLHHLITGGRPPTAITRTQAVVARQPDPLRPAYEFTPAVPHAVASVLARAAALHPGDRPRSAAEMRHLLREAMPNANITPPYAQRGAMHQAASASTRDVALTEAPTLPAQIQKAKEPAHEFPKRESSTRRRWLTLLFIVLFGVVLATFVVQQWQPTIGRELSATMPSTPIAPVAETTLSPPVTPLAATMLSTPVALVTATTDPPIAVTDWQPVPLGDTANARLDFIAPPSGDLVLGGIPFRLGERVWKSQASFAPNDTAPVSITITTDVPEAYRLHLLLNTGNGFTLFQNAIVGEVRTVCNDQGVVVAQLELGRDLREWQIAPKVVTTASRAREVWSDERGHIDLVSLDLPPVCREGRLQSVIIMDTSVENVRSLDPALNLVGMTVEHYQPR